MMCGPAGRSALSEARRPVFPTTATLNQSQPTGLSSCLASGAQAQSKRGCDCGLATCPWTTAAAPARPESPVSCRRRRAALSARMPNPEHNAHNFDLGAAKQRRESMTTGGRNSSSLAQ